MTDHKTHFNGGNRGWRSTKLHLALITMAGMLYAFNLTGAAHDLFGTFCMGFLTAAGIYSGASVIEKFTKAPPEFKP
jgi:hypothetical protein